LGRNGSGLRIRRAGRLVWGVEHLILWLPHRLIVVEDENSTVRVIAAPTTRTSRMVNKGV
jgi:hypothetical protein